MRAIVEHIIRMLPYMILAVPVYCIGRAFFCKIKKVNLNWLREIALFVLVIFSVGLASQTVIPKIEMGANGFSFVQSGVHKTNPVPFKVLFETYHEVFAKGHINYFLINFLGNIILFIPFGLIIPLLWETSTKKTILIGFCSSLFIELCQLFLARGTDVDDLILNTLGVFCGVTAYRFLRKHCKAFTEKFNRVTITIPPLP